MSALVPSIMMSAASVPTVVMAATAAPHMMPVTMTMAALYEDDAVIVGEHIWFLRLASPLPITSMSLQARTLPDSSRAGVASLVPPLVIRALRYPDNAS